MGRCPCRRMLQLFPCCFNDLQLRTQTPCDMDATRKRAAEREWPIMVVETNLILPDGGLVVFVDDTGHEALVPGQPVYGLGGCTVMSEHLDLIIRHPWQEVRRKVTGSSDAPLHANEFSRSAKREDIEAVASFFRKQPFARLGAIITIDTQLAPELGPVPPSPRSYNAGSWRSDASRNSRNCTSSLNRANGPTH